MSLPLLSKWSYFATICQLIRRDLLIFKEEFWGKFLDTAILLFTVVVVFGYFLPSYGLQSDYGPFLLIGVIAGFGFFEVVGKVSVMIADMEGDRTILYTLTLPIPSVLVFVYIGVSWALISSIISLLLFPLGKVLLWSQFDLSKICFWRFALIFLLSNLFFGFFALWLSSILKTMGSISHLFVRIVNPMYTFGCFMYSWNSVSQISSWIGFAHLLNPLVYIMEGMRSAALGSQGYLPFWFCFLCLAFFTVLAAWDGMRRLQKRLDCV
ncbi:MAG: ABC transporter permease [Rhabdochlamydiaceae bacterium]|nr:ABC transporter permease [Rhabdochlamydiaceae bacterium]